MYTDQAVKFTKKEREGEGILWKVRNMNHHERDNLGDESIQRKR